jgi:hypothetical protein
MYRDTWRDRFLDLTENPTVRLVAVIFGVLLLAKVCFSLFLRTLVGSTYYEPSEDPAQVQAALDHMLKVKIPPNFKPAEIVRAGAMNMEMALVTYIDKPGEAELTFAQFTPSSMAADETAEEFAHSTVRRFDPHSDQGSEDPVIRTRPLTIRGHKSTLTLVEEDLPALKKVRRSALVSFPGRHGTIGFAISYYGDSIKLDEIVKMLESLE